MPVAEKRPFPGGQGPPGDAKRPKPDMSAAMAKAQEVAARLAAKAKPTGGASSTPPVPPAKTGTAPASSAPNAKLEALKAKMAALKAGQNTANQGITTTTLDSTSPRFATTLGNRRSETPLAETKPQVAQDKQAVPAEEPVENPYFDPKAARDFKNKRELKPLIFNTPGKYLDQASKLRQQKRLEEIKKKLAIQTRRAGLDENSERGFLVQAPPDAEWWDEGIMVNPTYDCLNDSSKVRVYSDDSIITPYVQHPPLLKAPQEKRLVVTKPMYLTAKEQSKVRRMRRAGELKEQQAKIRLGLEPPPPPKVKRGNMMRVMGEQAIADPTAVEMLVEGQIQQRHEDHVSANAERKLTKEEIHKKLEKHKEEDALKGLYLCVFKINSLVYGKHRFQIDNNGKQHGLTGITLLNPEFNLVVIEGGAHSVNKYKKLMLNRINWQQNEAPNETQAENRAREPKWLHAVDENGQLKDHSDNKCILVFEGEIKERSFKKWASRVCETAGEAREALGRARLDSLWALAKSMD